MDLSSPFQYSPYWQDADSASARAMVFKAHAAVDLREERVVFAEPDVQSWREPSSALPHQNRSAGHDIAVVTLDAQALQLLSRPLRVTALSFL